ncbi:MAG: chromosome segregation protein SMC [Labilithrix sp.]|nr:chromosome segregation protein SMC [Labilithrix sp.]MCW5813984.1 chromosome segregation protein SMC [Labilithrix sp.]
MKIKRLELQGFKSFVDRTVVSFEHEIMGIVGPNGCGKSNIVDAIRWCMGEQSAKHLRGRSMEDVIFNGSESRTPADFAEVTLTFENDDPGDMPLEYKDYAEIAVTRRLHRSGDSEYLINKTPVRLKDITDLFLGTGVGTKAYSIVEQGKIGLIVSAKPEDRRLLIEEAAGITKFKSRKKQAERKMELTQQNLLRVGDIIGELERSLGSLKRQAAKAERYIAYRGELEDLQLHDSAQKWLELRGWIMLESNEVERLGLEADEARNTLAAREGELDAARQDAHNAEEALEQANTAAFAADNEARAEEAAIERAKDRIDALRRRETQAEGELAEIAEQAGTLATERAAVDADIAILEEGETGVANAVAAEEEKLATLSTESEDAERVVVELRQVISQAREAIAASEAKLEGFDRRKEDLVHREERISGEREQREGSLLELEARMEQLWLAVEDLTSGKVTTEEDRAQMEVRLGELRHEIAESERLLDEAKAEASKKRSRLHALSEMHARNEGVGAGAKALIETKSETLAGLLADRVEAPVELTPALAGLLGSHLEDVVVEDLERGVALLADLATKNKGRATIVARHPAFVAGRSARLPGDGDGDGEGGEGALRLVDHLRYAPEDEALVRAVIGDTVVVADVDAALAFRAETRADVEVVTRDGTVFHADGRVSGGNGEAGAHMLDVRREMRELTDEVLRLEALVADRLAHHQTLRTQIGETQGALERARQQAHQDELALVHAEKDLKNAEAEAAQHTGRVAELAAELAELHAKIATADAERGEAQSALDQAREGLAGLETRIGEAETSATEWREQAKAQQANLMERKVALAGAREKLAASRTTLQRLAQSELALTERSQRLEAELFEGARELGATAATLLKHKEQRETALAAAKAAQDMLTEARGTFERFRADLGEREAGLKDLRTRADETRAALGQHEMALRERELAMEHLLAGVREKFRGLDLARVVGDYHLRPPPDPESRARIAELSGLIDRMGSVNLDATREYEEAEKRYAFYTTQKQDLDKALADLERAIQQMNRESKKMFTDTFTAVNERFQKLFPTMFRGGRAELRLTNPEDMLETGIDIIAQPPGKKLASIELMSGGEKALTAVSLIFAIFSIRPSPFCILDEVDAPLDEANVGRYCEAIREMTDRSQFILITHIKKTMQMVDILHGVTMGEPGVSRLVSVKVSEAALAGKTTTGKVPTTAVA